MLSLPIDPILPELVSRLEKENALVLQAAPGSGKTTRVPPALLRAQFASGARKEIIVLEPRRLAAKYSARRVASEMGEEVGQTVGYQFRFENVGGPNTRLRFLTEGILLRRLQNDPKLERVAAVILDEFHERHLSTDVALGYLRHLQRTDRPDLRLIVMSATLDSSEVSRYLGGAPILEAQNRPFPVSIHHAAEPSKKYLELQIRDAVVRACERDDDDNGDILVFLPGMAEIRRAETAIREAVSGDKSGPLVFPLHGDLTKEEQDRALKKAERRRIILSTNLAETSLTVEGVTTIIDSGLHRQASYSWWSGMPALKTRPISRASAIQRAGRAGRTAPGRCFRLYTLGDFDSRPPFEIPEIRRSDLAQTLLELKALGIRDFKTFPWYEAPNDGSIESSWRLLYLLGALHTPGAEATLTPIGKLLTTLPIHPRIARFLIEASKLNVTEDALTLAAWISEGRLERIDVLDHLNVASRYGSGEPSSRVRSQLASALKSVSLEKNSPAKSFNHEDQLRFALLTGFPDRVARAKGGHGAEVDLLLSEGGSAKMDNSPALSQSEFLLTLEAQEQQHVGQARARLKVRSVSTVQEDWFLELSPTSLEDKDTYAWDSEREQVVARSQLRYGEIILSETSKPASPGPEVARTLLQALLGAERAGSLSRLPVANWPHLLSELVADSQLAETLETSLARANILRENFPKETVTDEEAIQNWISRIGSCIRRRELREIDWAYEVLAGLVQPELMARADRLVPQQIALPSGRKSRIYYAAGKSPWVESRLQDFFGMKKAPALLDGRVALTVHLLAPNQRALQITRDLESFWTKDYPELRRALSRRYPRHKWPENPLAPYDEGKS